MILMGQTFGFVDNLQDWELFVRACIHLAQLSISLLLLKYNAASHPLKVSPLLPPLLTNIISVQSIDIERLAIFSLTNLSSLLMLLLSNTQQPLVSKHYIVICFPDLTARQNSLSLDKNFQSIYSYERIQLGKLVNLRTMTISITESKRLTIIQEMTRWHDQRRSVTLLQFPPTILFKNH